MSIAKLPAFPLLDASQISVRIGNFNDRGCSLLLYKDSRVDMDILDETVGPENWQRQHYELKQNIYCSVGICIGDAWVWKDDCGSESNTEKEKGEASDSFKRACVNWGIGRELYSCPRIWVSSDKISIVEKNNKKTTYDTFSVEKIAYTDDRKILGISVKNQHGIRVFVWKDDQNA